VALFFREFHSIKNGLFATLFYQLKDSSRPLLVVLAVVLVLAAWCDFEEDDEDE
jgi:hypothetical protein